MIIDIINIPPPYSAFGCPKMYFFGFAYFLPPPYFFFGVTKLYSFFHWSWA